MKFLGINALIVIILLILTSWIFWCTKSTFVCNEKECYVINYDMFDLPISKKTIIPDNIQEFKAVKYRYLGGKNLNNQYFIVLYLNDSKYKIPKSYGSDYAGAKSMADYLQQALTNKPLDINVEI